MRREGLGRNSGFERPRGIVVLELPTMCRSLNPLGDLRNGYVDSRITAKHHNEAANHHMAAASKHDAGNHDEAHQHSEKAHASSTAAHGKSTEAYGESAATKK
jgi:hypothetical protein